MDQFNIRVSDDTKQIITDLIEEWRSDNESNGDVFSRIVTTAKEVGQDKPVELVKALSGSRQTVNVLLRQINSIVEVEQTQIEDLKKQLVAKDQEIETQATEYKKQFLELGDANREKVANLQTKIDELKDWLRIATEEKAKLEQSHKADQDALQSYRESISDKKDMLAKLQSDLDDRNAKVVELQQIADATQETLKSELAKQDEKHRADTAKLEKQHQFELEQQRMQVSAELEKVKAEKDAERSQAVAGKQEELYKQFGEERKELQQKLDDARQLLDSVKDQNATLQQKNLLLEQQVKQLQTQINR